MTTSSEILHEIKEILTVYQGVEGREGEEANRLMSNVAKRSIKVIEAIISDPSNICLMECPYRKHDRDDT